MSIVRSSIIISSISLGVSVISFFCQLVIANYFGANSEMDLYLSSSSIPFLFSALISSSLSYSFTPFLIRYKLVNSDNYPNFLGNIYIKLIRFSLLFFFIVFLITTFYNYHINSILITERAINVTMIIFVTCLTSILNIFNGFLNSVYNANDSFKLPVILSIFPYVFMMLFIFFFHNTLSSLSIAFGLFFGTLVTNLTSYLFIKQPISFKKLSNRNFKEINEYFKKIPVIAISMLCFTIYQTIDSFWAPRIGTSNLSYLGYCQRLLIAFGALIIIGPSTILVPRLTLAIKEGRKNDFLNDSIEVIKLIIALASLFAVIGSVLSIYIVTVLFQRGAFTANDAIGVASILPYMLFGMVFMLCVVMLFRSFFASSANWNVIILGVLATLFYFIFSGIGSYYFGLKGIAISYLASWVLIFLISLLLIFKNDFRIISNKQTTKFFLNQLLLLVIVFISVNAIKALFDFYIDNNFKLKSFLILIISGTIGLFTYLIFSTKIIKQVEIIAFINKIGIR